MATVANTVTTPSAIHVKSQKGPGSQARSFSWLCHVLSSGVAGTMAANHSGLQWGTVRNLLMAWVLTLPVAMMLSGFLFWTFRKIF